MTLRPRALVAVVAVFLGGTGLAASAARQGSAVTFRVGVALATINPTYPVYLGGYGGGPPGGTIKRHVDPLTGKPEDLTVRAVAIARGRHVVEFATIDSQGYMAGYDEGPYGLTTIRRTVAAWLDRNGARGSTEAEIIISSLHEHAVPTVYGIYGPMSHQLRYLAQVAGALTKVCEQAFARARPATLEWGRAEAPWLGGGDVAEANEFEGWPRDGQLVALRARDAHTGATIATYVSEPAYPNIVYGPADLVPTKQRAEALISPDFPHYAEAYVERALGGTALLASSSLSNQASPEQADSAPSPDLPHVDGLQQTRGFDDAIQMGTVVGRLIVQALAHARPVTDGTVAGAEQYVVTPVDNPADIGLGAFNAFGRTGEKAVYALSAGQAYPVARSLKPPYSYGAAIGTWVTGLRVGKLLFLSEPGEFAYPIRQTWVRSIQGADAVAAIGAAQDFLGYEYPAYVTPFTLMGGDELVFSPSVSLGDQVFTAGQLNAKALGFDVDFAQSPETTATENDYAQVVRPGMHLLPDAVAGDLGGNGWTVRLLAASQLPRTNMRCSNPVFLIAPPGCSLPEGSMGPFHWSFGDGTSAITAVQARVRAFFSPYVGHRYRRPGRYRVVVWAADKAGARASTSIVLTVYPPLSAAAVSQGSTYFARARGGDGAVVHATWVRPDGMSLQTDAVPQTWLSPGTRLTIIDGTGTTATVVL